MKKSTRPSFLNNREYYNRFAAGYENKRHFGYHRMVDDFEVSLLERYIKPEDDLLEIGCGTGLIMQRLVDQVASVKGIDISDEMLAKAQEKGLDVERGDAAKLPFDENQFDCIYSFKVLAHIEQIKETLKEASRVTKPGGRMVLEFYNKRSMRTLVKHIKPPTKIAQQTSDEAVFTRYDSLPELEGYLPEGCSIEAIRGIRIVSPAYFVYQIPLINKLFYTAENMLKDSFLGRFGGFIVLVIRNEKK